MDSKLAKYQRYKSILRKLILLSGIWPCPEDQIRFHRIIFVYGLFVFSVIIAKCLFFCLSNVNSVIKLLRGTATMLSMITLLLKMVLFAIHREDLVILENELCKKFEDELKNEDSRPILLKRISMYTFFMYLLGSLLSISFSQFTAVPIINIITKAKYLEIYHGKYPFTVIPQTPRYWMVFFFELSAGPYIWNVMNGVDSVFGLYCFRLSGLIRLAGHRCRQMKPSDPDYRMKLRECIKMHQFVLKVKEALQSTFGIIVLWTYVTNSVVTCSLLWQANQVKNGMSAFRGLYFICFGLLKLLQAFTYAYYGSGVSQESETYEDSVYTSNWPGSGNVQFMKDLLMIRSQRTITLKALGYFDVTMEMFEKIVNTTISYFFLLRTMESSH